MTENAIENPDPVDTLEISDEDGERLLAEAFDDGTAVLYLATPDEAEFGSRLIYLEKDDVTELAEFFALAVVEQTDPNL